MMAGNRVDEGIDPRSIQSEEVMRLVVRDEEGQLPACCGEKCFHSGVEPWRKRKSRWTATHGNIGTYKIVSACQSCACESA